jgi:hypothetical protein
MAVEDNSDTNYDFLRSSTFPQEQIRVEEHNILGRDAVYSGRSSPIYRRNVLPPSSGQKMCQGGNNLLSF